MCFSLPSLYAQVAEQNNLRLIPVVFSHTCQIHKAFKIFVKEQIRAKLEHFEGPVKSSKVRSHMNWWVKCISAVIAKTASRNVAFKARKVRDSIMEGQDRFIMRELDDAEVGLGEDCEEASADVGSNADLYVANQESADLISEAHMEDAPSRFMGQDALRLQPLSASSKKRRSSCASI